MNARFLSLADGAVVVELGSSMSCSLLEQVSALDAAVRREAAAGRLEGVIETVPSYRSLALLYDPRRTTRAVLLQALQPLVDACAPGPRVAGAARTWVLPVCYGGEHGPDLAPVASACGLTSAEVIALHARRTYAVYVLGFLPGFAFMGDVAEPLQLPRRSEPRTRVPQGSVGIAGPQTAVYPWESPGGWHLLGRCPVPLFDPRRTPPALLAPGDRVTFEPVDVARLRALEAALAAGQLAPEGFLRR